MSLSLIARFTYVIYCYILRASIVKVNLMLKDAGFNLMFADLMLEAQSSMGGNRFFILR